jgi:DNA-binding NarL/FixJ family response regulator
MYSHTDSAALIDSLWRAARSALAETAARPCNDALLQAWDELTSGHMAVLLERSAGNRIGVVARVNPAPEPLTALETSTLLRVLCGEQQKAIAVDLSVAASTASGHFVAALTKIALAVRSVPLALVLAAVHRAGIVRVETAHCTAFEWMGTPCIALTVPKPALATLTDLSGAERDVAQLLIEGRARWEIAQQRSTSLNTIARQCHSIFKRLGATGRYGITRRAAELGCFGLTPAASRA